MHVLAVPLFLDATGVAVAKFVSGDFEVDNMFRMS